MAREVKGAVAAAMARSGCDGHAAVADHKQAREINFRLLLVIDEYKNYRIKAEKAVCDLQ